MYRGHLSLIIYNSTLIAHHSGLAPGSVFTRAGSELGGDNPCSRQLFCNAPVSDYRVYQDLEHAAVENMTPRYHVARLWFFANQARPEKLNDRASPD
jgi:hypothetical protein